MKQIQIQVTDEQAVELELKEKMFKADPVLQSEYAECCTRLKEMFMSFAVSRGFTACGRTTDAANASIDINARITPYPGRK